jgi:hypothetical protein
MHAELFVLRAVAQSVRGPVRRSDRYLRSGASLRLRHRRRVLRQCVLPPQRVLQWPMPEQLRPTRLELLPYGRRHDGQWPGLRCQRVRMLERVGVLLGGMRQLGDGRYVRCVLRRPRRHVRARGGHVLLSEDLSIADLAGGRAGDLSMRLRCSEPPAT